MRFIALLKGSKESEVYVPSAEEMSGTETSSSKP